MEKKIGGKIVKVRTLWWIKINTKPARMDTFDGAIFPHLLKVSYHVDGVDYCKRKFVKAEAICPREGKIIDVFYEEKKPSKCRISF